MIIINTVDTERFSLDGIEYYKNFTPVVAGDTLRLQNTYNDIHLFQSTNYANITVDGATFLDVASLQSALLPVVYTRNTLGGGGGGSTEFTSLTDTPANYTGQAGKKVVVNSSEDALEFVDDTGGSVVSPTPKGILYNKDTWVDTSDFTTFGNATAVMSGSKINIGTTTNGSYENYLTLGNTTGLNKWKSTIEIKVINAPTTTTYGIGLGIRSANTLTSQKLNLASTINLSTANNFSYILTGQSYITSATSATQFSFSQNDTVRLTVEQDLDIITSTFFNVTTNQIVTVDYTYTTPLTPFPSNTGDFVIHILGGTYEMQSMKLESKEWEKSKVMFVGDSKTNGFSGDSFGSSFAQQFNQLIGGIADSSGGSDKTNEVLMKVPEIIDLAPQKVVLNIGSNDKRFGNTFVQWQTNYDSIVAQLEADGITVYHLLQLNEASGLFFTDYNNHITTSYNSDNIIDAGIIPLSADGVHPNQTAMDQIFMAVVSKIGSLV